MSKYLNMDWPRAFTYVGANYETLIEKARAFGNDFVLAGTDNWMHPEESYFNCLHMHDVNGTDAAHLTRSAIELRRKLWANMEVLRRHVPGCERISLITTAALAVQRSVPVRQVAPERLRERLTEQGVLL